MLDRRMNHASVAEGDKFNSRWQRHRNTRKSPADPERVEDSKVRVVVQSRREECDPFRVGLILSTQPVALPPAIYLVAFGDRYQCELTSFVYAANLTVHEGSI